MMNEEAKQQLEATRRPRQTRSYTLTPADVKLINWGAEYLGTSNSEFVRTAIRAYASQLQLLDKRLK